MKWQSLTVTISFPHMPLWSSKSTPFYVMICIVKEQKELSDAKPQINKTCVLCTMHKEFEIDVDNHVTFLAAVYLISSLCIKCSKICNNSEKSFGIGFMISNSHLRFWLFENKSMFRWLFSDEFKENINESRHRISISD